MNGGVSKDAGAFGLPADESAVACGLPLNERVGRLRFVVDWEVLEGDDGAADGVFADAFEPLAGMGTGRFDGDRSPGRVPAQVVDHGGVTGGDVYAMAFLAVKVGDGAESG